MRKHWWLVAFFVAIVTGCAARPSALPPGNAAADGDRPVSGRFAIPPPPPPRAPIGAPAFRTPTAPSDVKRTPVTAAAGHASFFNNEIALSNGVYYLQFSGGTPFGYYSYLSDTHYVYHFDLGWEYFFDSFDPTSVYLYDFATGHFWYTGTNLYPYIYDFSIGSYLYYYADTGRGGHYTTNPRYFYDFASHSVITLPSVPPPLGNTVVYYQPTPYRPPTNDLRGTHVLDGWLPSNFYGQSFQKDTQLQAGGFSDTYLTYIQFDLTGLPTNVLDATLQLHAISRGDNSTLTSLDISSPNSAWATTDSNMYLSTSMTWSTRPASNTYITSVNPSSLNTFWSVPITSLYNGWRNGTTPNHGVVVSPTATNNNFDVWNSSREANDGLRPLLRLSFNSSAPAFKMPLPRGVAWLITTEIGGYDCAGSKKDTAHADLNYYSIDFGWSNKDPSTGQRVYAQPTQQSSTIPITPAADGVVTDVNGASFPFDGNYVVVSHDRTGRQDTGYSTRYLHLHDTPLVHTGDHVTQGSTVLGYMGNTPTSAGYGMHLHFGVRYNDKGYPDTPELSSVVMSGWLLKSFQTECSGNTWMRFYTSS